MFSRRRETREAHEKAFKDAERQAAERWRRPVHRPRPQLEKELPIHHLMDLYRWQFLAESDKAQEQIAELENEAKQFDLGDKPEQRVGEDLLAISRRHKALQASLTDRTLRFENLSAELEAAIVRAETCRRMIIQQITIIEDRIEFQRGKLKAAPHNAEATTHLINLDQANLSAHQRLLFHLEECTWARLDEEGMHGVRDDIRFDVSQLISIHRSLAQAVQAALPVSLDGETW